MIEIRNLHKIFGTHRVLNGLDLTVREGETKVVIGRSGVGKSVLLKCILGLLRPEYGSIRIGGTEVTELDERAYDAIRRRIGMVFQGAALFDSMTVAENVGFALQEFGGIVSEEVARRVRESLARVGLEGTEALYPASLSGGMKKRVSVARALCVRPDIMLYDEPTDEVDPVTGDTLSQLINRLRDSLGVTSIVVTHDMPTAFKVGDTVAMLYRGRLIADGTPEDLRGTSHPVVRQFIRGEARGPIMEEEDLLMDRGDA